MKPELQRNKCCNKTKQNIYFISLQVWFHVQQMLQFILLQHLFYFTAHYSVVIVNENIIRVKII